MQPASAQGFGSAEFAVLLGALIGVAGSLSLFAFRRGATRKRLRRAFRSEILSMREMIDDTARMLAIERPHEDLTLPPDTLVDTVYRENASDVGLLSVAEIEDITSFYSQLVVVRRTLQEVDDESSIPPGTADEFRRQFIALQNEMVAALDSLEGHLGLSPTSGRLEFDPVEYEPADIDHFPTKEVTVSNGTDTGGSGAPPNEDVQEVTTAGKEVDE